MSKEKSTKKVRATRGAGPKISLGMTGFGTFAVLILTLILFIANRWVVNNSGQLLVRMGIISASDAEEPIISAILSELDPYIADMISEILTPLIVIFLICGIWCLIFWIICLRSKTHRARDIICTFVGRIPMIILAITLFRIYQDFADAITSSELLTWLISFFDELSDALNTLTAALGIAAIVMFVWIFLAILLSIFGWRKKAR